jgi:formylglycine-generating enzyme required for sulfatase activity
MTFAVLPTPAETVGFDTPRVRPLPPGEFKMGENNHDRFANDTERPAHPVRMSAGIAMGLFPVTVQEFRAFAPRHAPQDAERLPAVRVNWHEASGYCEWLSRRTGHDYRLPTEAEWEYACRAGSQTPFAFGEEITPAQANYLYDEIGQRVGLGHRTPVGQYPANAFGLYDLHGNVCEWVADAWHPNLRGAPDRGQAWDGGTRSNRVIRGGAWDYLPRLLRSSWRDWRSAECRADNIGFRVVRMVST